MTTIVKHCNCKHTYQDKIYGQNQRVHNTFKDKSGNIIARCTVCKSQTRA